MRDHFLREYAMNVLHRIYGSVRIFVFELSTETWACNNSEYAHVGADNAMTSFDLFDFPYRISRYSSELVCWWRRDPSFAALDCFLTLCHGHHYVKSQFLTTSPFGWNITQINVHLQSSNHRFVSRRTYVCRISWIWKMFGIMPGNSQFLDVESGRWL